FRILGRYMHLECKVLRNNGQNNLFTLQILRAAIAKANRSSLRIPIKKSEAYISNIRTSKHTIDASLLNVPTSVKVNFSAVEQSLKNSADLIKIDVFGKRGTILDEIRATGQSLLIQDTSDPVSYSPPHSDLVDYAEYLDEHLDRTIQQYRNAKIRSEIIVPIIYYTHDNSPIPLGYIQIQSKSETFTMERLAALQQTASAMVERIRDSNTVLVQERQKIINLSRGGLKICIEHQDLKRYLAPMSGFTFDLFFRSQSPITLYANIRAAFKDRMDDLILGLEISGNSSRKSEMKRFNDNLDQLESELRAQMQQARVT
ncbi:MAG: DUF1577 domain-containing protein, partial [Leptospiraceae bacterium]|nr:DUF1577 domain-containing protein [Leptospiraceae bacterium]